MSIIFALTSDPLTERKTHNCQTIFLEITGLIPAFIVSLFRTIHSILQYVYTVNSVIGCNLPLVEIHTTEH